jgi:D-alanyl-D-alanine dipeptidase
LKKKLFKALIVTALTEFFLCSFIAVFFKTDKMIFSYTNDEIGKKYIPPAFGKELRNINLGLGLSSKVIAGIKNVVLINNIDPDIILDLRYASANNFTGHKLYPVAVGILRKETAERLAEANAKFKMMGYKIKVFDAYRPVTVQKELWNVLPIERYVANPYAEGSIHSNGGAVDITLVNMDGSEVEMPSEFDTFSISASRNNLNMTKEAKANLDLLTKVMDESGFDSINSEWWHFNDKNTNNYSILNIDLNIFIK